MYREHPLIAVIDDDTAYVDMMREVLTDEGYQVICCLNGREAQMMIREQKPDLAILDIRLEDFVSGWEILELMRRVPATKDMPLMVCSADAQFLHSHVDQLREYRCQVLEKPFMLSELFAKIQAGISSTAPDSSEPLGVANGS